MSSATDRDFLLGVLALRMGYLQKDQLLDAMDAWSETPGHPLGAILVDQGALGEGERPLLEIAVDKHLARVGGPEPVVTTTDKKVDTGKSGDTTGPSNVELASSELADTVHSQTDAVTRPGLGRRSGEGGRFRILGPHARGGLGEVFVARDEELGRDVALKEIHARYADNQELRARFLLEAEVTGGLEHPGIVPVYGLGQDDSGRPFYAMRFIRGESLMEAIRRLHVDGATPRSSGGHTLELRKLLSAFVDVCNALAYAHGRGVIHRDLKPDNVMLGPYGETLLVDWGLAKLVERDAQPESERTGEGDQGDGTQSVLSLLRPPAVDGSAPTQFGTVVGTLRYMSPEQAAGLVDQLGPACDIYSLGTTLYSLLTGETPFAGETVEEIRLAVIAGRCLSPRQLNPAVPRALEAICLKAMAVDPARRYGTAKQLADDVEAWMADEPVSAWREPLRVRAGRWMRRNRTLVTGAAAAMLVALVSLSVGVVLLTAANERERLATSLAVQREGEAKHNLAIAQAAEKRANQNFDMAWQAVDKYLTRVSMEPGLRAYNLERLRRDLLTTAGEFYERFVEQQPDEPQLRADRAAAHLRLARITAEIGSQQRAIELGETALAAYKRIAAELPENSEYSHMVAQVRGELGNWYRQIGEADKARTMQQQALATAEALATSAPDNPEHKALAATAQHGLAVLDADAEKFDEAESQFEAAIEIREALANAHPDVRDYRHQLAESQRNLGVLLARADRYEDAAQLLAAAADLHSKLVGEDREDARYLSGLAAAGDELASLYSRWAGGAADTKAAIESALAVRKRLAREHPNVVEYERALAKNHTMLAQYWSRQRRHYDAQPHWQAARDILQRLVQVQGEVPSLKWEYGTALYNLGYTYAQTGRADDALTTLTEAAEVREQLSEVQPDNPELLRELGTVHNDLGVVHKAAQRFDEAAESLGDALRIRGHLTSKWPDVANYRAELAMVLVNLAELALARGDTTAALKHADEAIEAVTGKRPLIESHPAATLMARNAHWRRALVYVRLKQYDDAIVAFDRALAVDAKCGPNNSHDFLCLCRAEVSLRSNDATAADRQFNTLAELAKEDGPRLFNLANICVGQLRGAATDESLSAEDRERITDRLAAAAVRFLSQALAVGYFDDPAQVQLLKIDWRWAPIRQRADFRTLVEELESR